METEKLNQALYDKMAEEQKSFRDWLMEQPPGEILNHAYEYSAREDILMAMEESNLPEQQAAALLKSPSPLADVYKDFCKIETGQMETVRDCIEARADAMLEAEKESRAVPLYRESFAYAQEHDEIPLFRASHQANIDCKNAIEAAIREGFDGMYLSGDAAKKVLAEFSAERVSCVLAVTLREKEHDARFSRSNQEWAAGIPQFDMGNRRCYYMVESHPAVLDGFVGNVRKEIKAAREQPEQAAKKPSIKEQLAAKLVAGEPPSRPKDRGAR